MEKRDGRIAYLSIIDIINIDKAYAKGDYNDALRIITTGFKDETQKRRVTDKQKEIYENRN